MGLSFCWFDIVKIMDYMLELWVKIKFVFLVVGYGKGGIVLDGYFVFLYGIFLVCGN